MERGLVDRLGTLSAAVESAAGLAGLEADSYSVAYVEQELTFAERFILSLTSTALRVVDRLVVLPSWPSSITAVLESTLEPLEFVDRLNDPRGIYAYCFCDTR
jgi:ClpP class serine protease